MPTASQKPLKPASAIAPVMPRNDAAEIWSPASASPLPNPPMRRPAT